MSGRCSIRALWILNAQDAVVFSRRFPVVERRWRLACERENEGSGGYALRPLLPIDAEVSAAFAERRERQGSIGGFGIRTSLSKQGSDSWVDDPITRHVISLSVNKDGEELLLWPLIFHTRGYFYVAVLPLVEPHHLKSYDRMCNRIDCGNSVGGAESMSTLLLDLPCITGALMAAHVLGDIITGDSVEPEIISNPGPSVGGLLDSLTGSIGISGISTRGKPAAAPVSSSTGVAVTGSLSSDVPKNVSRPIDKEALRTFISVSMPFGTPLDLSFSNISAIKTNGFSSADVPPQDMKQPAWKPYLYKGKQRILFSVQETISAAMYDRDDIPDTVTISGQVICRAELDGLPDISCPLIGTNTTSVDVLSFHPCAQVPENGVDKQSVMFTPPLGNFVLMCYQAPCILNPPVKGFYQLSMVSEDEGAFLFKLWLMEGYKAPLTMDFCTVSMPFPRRKLASFEGTPSIGTVTTTDHSIEWKIITSGRGITGKSVEATFPGTVKFSPLSSQRAPSKFVSVPGGFADDDSEVDPEGSGSMTNVEEILMKKMNKDLLAVDLVEPFCWQAYDYAKVSFKISGGSLSGVAINPKSVLWTPYTDDILAHLHAYCLEGQNIWRVSIYPSVKAVVELSMQASSGDYVLWNTLGKCPFAAVPNGS